MHVNMPRFELKFIASKRINYIVFFKRMPFDNTLQFSKTGLEY